MPGKNWSTIFLLCMICIESFGQSLQELKRNFKDPPDNCRPGVYWYFMDGNISKDGMTADLESMKRAGIGTVLFLEVNVGIPRGKVDYFSEEWKELFAHAERESRRLGIEIMLGIGPGWTGSGGPWVKPEESMQQLVYSSVAVTAASDTSITVTLPVPPPRKPFFGEGVFVPALKKKWQEFYEDVAVLAFPYADSNILIKDIGEKALYYREPYSSQPGVKQFIPSSVNYDPVSPAGTISKNQVVDLTGKLQHDSLLTCTLPKGKWTIMRFVRRNNGAVTRPAPLPGLGFECDKLDTIALDHHLSNFTETILTKINYNKHDASRGGIKSLHMDSWEMGAQNWTLAFRQEFIKRRGYDPLPFYPVYAGKIVESPEISERFLWDLRQTAQELILDYHAGHLKEYCHKHGFKLSIEPYDMNPASDMELGAVADLPMCEFWSKDYGFNTWFSTVEATSVAHVNGQPIVGAESFTADDREGWKQYPGSMKNEGDWAFAAGINKFVFHTFAHQPLNDSLKPGMTMGPYGVHWDRGQTWWPMAGAYHSYISRCSYLLRQGKAVADILYLTPEGSPHVFRAPASALTADPFLPDRKGYNFDGCAPTQLYNAFVKDNKISFPGGASYHLLIIPAFETMTPALLEKIKSLVNDGATVVGIPPKKSPGLSGYPACDEKIKVLAEELWGSLQIPVHQTTHKYGKGKIIWGGEISSVIDNLYPAYDLTAMLLAGMKIQPDVETDSSLRYTHRATGNADIYFISNRTGKPLSAQVKFRSVKGTPVLWDPITGESRNLKEYSVKDGRTTVPLTFDEYQSFFVLFSKEMKSPLSKSKNFPSTIPVATIDGPWSVYFAPERGGSGNAIFNELHDWATDKDSTTRYFSGIALYKKTFDLPVNDLPAANSKLFLQLGEVKNLARIKLNGKELGVLWTAPWRIDITKSVVQKNNKLEMEVANLWPNRLIGDERLPDDGIKDGQWPDWLLNHRPRTSGRHSFATNKFYNKDSPLLRSGLIGPVVIVKETF
jgi:hypothetical protein